MAGISHYQMCKHNCPRFVWPSTNEDYWIPKINGNVERDKRNKEDLESLGWKVLVVWECELKKNSFDKTMQRLISEIVRSESNDE